MHQRLTISRHMLDAAETAIEFMRGKDRSALDDDRMLLFAVVRAVEILDEAASRVTASTRERYAELPWRAASSMRNRLIHGYFDIDRDILWVTLTLELPALVEKLSLIMKGAEADKEQPPAPQRSSPISAIFTRHSAGPVLCTDSPVLSTATVTGMSTTSNS